jgi:hypothetical protein
MLYIDCFQQALLMLSSDQCLEQIIGQLIIFISEGVGLPAMLSYS